MGRCPVGSIAFPGPEDRGSSAETAGHTPWSPAAMEPRVTIRVLPGATGWTDRPGRRARDSRIPAGLATSESLAEREGKGDSDPAHSPPGRRLTRLDLANGWTEEPAHGPGLMSIGSGSSSSAPGSSARLEDVGAKGEWPDHPELLDWLAVEFREPSGRPVRGTEDDSSWDVKRMVRLLVNSATYRQDSVPVQRISRSIPKNRLLAAPVAAAARGRVRPRQRPGRRGPAQPRRRRPQRHSPISRPATTPTSSSPIATTSPTRTTASTAAASTCTGSGPSCTRCWPTSTPRRARNAPRPGTSPTRRSRP